MNPKNKPIKMYSRKSEMFKNIRAEKTSNDFQHDTHMYLAMLAYETYGNSVRDNSFEELVQLGKELENPEGAQ